MRITYLALLLLSTPVLSQTQSNSSTDMERMLRNQEEIIRQNKLLMQQLKASQEENKRLRKERRPAPVAATTAPSATEPTRQEVPGWFIKVIPWTPDGRADPVGRFPTPSSNFNFGLHAQHFPGNTRFIYQGESVFHPTEDGEYTFVIALEPVAIKEATFFSIGYNCRAELQVNGNTIVQGATEMEEPRQIEGDLYRPQYFSGRLRMTPEPGKRYALAFRADCWAVRNRTATWYDNYLAGWKKNRFRISVKTPADMTARPFRNEELFYLGQK